MANIINGTDTGSGGLITTGDSSDELQLQTAETARVTLTNTAVVVNEGGNDVDFRVEGDTDANLLFVDASTDRVGIGKNNPGRTLDVNGTIGSVRSGSTAAVLQVINDNNSWNIGTGTSTSQFKIDNNLVGTALTIDSSNNVGIGVTPSAWSAYKAIQLGSVGSISSSIGGQDVIVGSNWYFDGTNSKYIANGFATHYAQFNGVHTWRTAPSGTAGNAITFTQAMTLDASGRLLVGTTAKGTYGGNAVEFRGANLSSLGSNDTGNLAIFTTDSQAADVGAVISLGGVYSGATPYAFGAIAARKENSTSGNAQGYLQFYTTNAGNGITEAARIDSSGRLLVGYTSVVSGFPAGTVAASGYATKAGSSAGINTAANVFNIEWTGSPQLWIDTTNVGTLATTSDYRTKRNITTQEQPALDRITQLRPVTYQRADYGTLFQADDVVREGFIAHELAEVIPSAVEGEKDAEDQIQSLKLDALCSVMVKAIQELKAELDTVKAELATLKG